MKKVILTLWTAAFGCLANTAFAQVPANNNFASPQVITATSGSASGTNVNATLESGEPTTTAGFTGGKSVWFNWTAPSTGSFTFSLTAGFDSQLALYSASSVGNLNLNSKGEDDPRGLGGDTVVLAANSGWTYQIRVTGYLSQSGSFTLNWLPAPPNNHLADAQPLNLYNGTVSLTASNIGATVESGEVSFTGLPAPAKTVWYQLFISADTTVTVSTAGSNFNTVLSIFKRNGLGVGGLAAVAGNDNSGALVTSQAAFPATLSVGVYYIAVGGSGGAQGSITLAVTSSVVQPNPIAGQGYERLVSFPDSRVAGLPNLGAGPGQLTPASNGFLYGTTASGGENDFGTVFKMTLGGQLTTFVEFTGVIGNRKGSKPTAVLLESTDGNFYGTTSKGGTNDLGTVFRMTPGGSFTTLFEFTGTSGAVKGASPVGAIVHAADGTLYGITSSGGQFDLGTVFRILHDGTFQTLVEFSGPFTGSARGSNPTGLVAADDGNVYGTFYQRDPSSIFGAGGGIFRITNTGAYSEVHSFQASGGGYAPVSLSRGPGGALYGVTAGSPARDIYETDYPPIVFKYTLGGSAQILATFDFYSSVNLHGFDDAGNLFGTKTAVYVPGGSFQFKITPNGLFETLPDFSSIGVEARGYVRGSDGNFFQTTFSGGFQDAGTVFRVSPTGESTTLLEFSNQGFIDKGQSVLAGLVEHPNGFFYGTTGGGGNDGYGVIFKMAKDGTITKLIDFTGSTGRNPGGNPAAELLVGSDGNLYGTTTSGPLVDFSYQYGTMFRASPEGDFKSLFTFTGDHGNFLGDGPVAQLVEGSDGLLYGSTQYGGSSFAGTVFRASKLGIFENLINFAGGGRNGVWDEGGGLPGGALVEDAQGRFYGTTRYSDLNHSGTVFRMDSMGNRETLVQFAGAVTGNLGHYPIGGVTPTGEGNYYGTTTSGGLFGYGTVYRLKPSGVLDVMVNFTGPDGPRRGSSPKNTLEASGDGWFYGTTTSGGIGNQGTVFRLKTTGEFETLLDFAYYSGDAAPVGKLLFASDGNLYGARRDALFRLVLPGPPMIYSFEVASSVNDSAVIQGKVNPRGSACSVVVEYAEDAAISSPVTVSLRSGLTGVKTTQVGKTLSLVGGRKYYYRIRATNGNGVTLGPVTAFTTPGPPVPLVTGASAIETNRAQLNGTVDAQYADTTVSFEYARLGDLTPDLGTPIPAIIPGDTDEPVPVKFTVENLDPGITYYYRIVATNAAGKVFSEVGEFSALTKPIASLTDAEALSTTRARVNGTVDPRGSVIDEILFQYGIPDETGNVGEDQWLPANSSPSMASGPVPVTAALTGLAQGTTYLYRIRASGPGGIGLSETGTFRLSLLSGLVQVFPDPPLPSSGTLTVNFTPASRGKWRFEGETSWRSSGVVAGHLASGKRRIEFLPLAGYLSPPEEILDIANKKNVTLERVYYQTPAVGTGELTVYLKPDGVAARWRFISDDVWHGSGGTPVTGLPAGTYLVVCEPVAGRVTPPIASVSIDDDVSRELTLTYFTDNVTTAPAPQPLSFNNVSKNEDMPFAYVGQIRSEVGSSTGFVVKRRVVATAAHVVYDDGTLKFLTNLQWLLQRHSKEHEPQPLVPRGYYLAAGYDDQRKLDASPGEGSDKSQDLDYAALYFLEEAGRGGYGGYLATDAGDDNEFLKSPAGKIPPVPPAKKILAGYAVDGIPDSDEGKLHATAPFTADLTPAYGETWTTTAVRGLGGCSGGPLFVRHSSGSYFPAAIYLGGSGQTVVRAIDSKVVDLFLRAENSGNGGGNDTGGGITHTSVTGTANTDLPGSLKVEFTPNLEAARWGIKPENPIRRDVETKTSLAAGPHELVVLPVAGYKKPESERVKISAGQLTTVRFKYVKDDTASGPEISLEQPPGTLLTDGVSSTSFGSPVVKTPITKTYSIKNLGKLNLTDLFVTIDGADAKLFSLTQPSTATLAQGKSTTFKITFTPAAPGTFTATLHIASNDADEKPFDIVLTGKGVAKPSRSLTKSGIARLPSWTDFYPNSRITGIHPKDGGAARASVVILPDGSRYRALTVETFPGAPDQRQAVEVSSNLVDWHSGHRHTTVLIEDPFQFKVRDNTPFTSEKKRFIRLKSIED